MTKRRNRFTLIELMVAVGLLSLIMMMLLQLFSGAQKLWVASERTNNVYADARVAMELMTDVLTTVQFSHGEKVEGGKVVRDKTQDMIFSMDTKTTDDGRPSGSVIFVSKTTRDLPMKNTNTRFIQFRLGGSGDSKTKGKLLMLIYTDKNGENTFYGFFPSYSGAGGNRNSARTSLISAMNALVTEFKSRVDNTTGGEYEYCQVIAENVVAFKLTAYRINSTSGKLEKQTDDTDIAEPPHMIEIQLTVLDPESYRLYTELVDNNAPAARRQEFLDQHKRTFTRSVFIGDRWALETQ